MPFSCNYCGNKVKTQRGLRQHIDGKPECRAMEKARAGLVDVYTLHRKSPPFASIPKRTYEETTPGQDFELSDIDAILCLSKPKRSRRFADVQDGETGHLADDMHANALCKF